MARKATKSEGNRVDREFFGDIIAKAKITETVELKSMFSSGLKIMDYYNGRYNYSSLTKQYEPTYGLPMGKPIQIIGITGVGKSALATKMGLNCVTSANMEADDYTPLRCFHFDMEAAFSDERASDVSNIPLDTLNEKMLYDRRTTASLEQIYTVIKETALKKIDTQIMVKNLFNGENILFPTSVIIDTIVNLQISDTLGKTELGSILFESGSQAKANNIFYQRLPPILNDGNITLISVNHIREAVEINSFAKKPKQIPYLNQGESLPGGKGSAQTADYLLRLTLDKAISPEKTGGDWGDTRGSIVECRILKSRHSFAGRSFKIFFVGTGFDDDLTTLYFMMEHGLLSGNKNGYSLTTDYQCPVPKFSRADFKKLMATDEYFREAIDWNLQCYMLENIVPSPTATIENIAGMTSEGIEQAQALEEYIKSTEDIE